MHRIFLAVVLLVASVAGCGSDSPGGGSGSDGVAMCNDGAAATCQKLFTCAEGEPYRAIFGANQQECTTGLQADCAANSANNACDPGETYHADKAAQCLAAVKAVTCAQLSNPTSVMPAVCADACTAP